MAHLSDLPKPTNADTVSFGLQNLWRERLTGEVNNIFSALTCRDFWWPAGVPPRDVDSGA